MTLTARPTTEARELPAKRQISSLYDDRRSPDGVGTTRLLPCRAVPHVNLGGCSGARFLGVQYLSRVPGVFAQYCCRTLVAGLRTGLGTRRQGWPDRGLRPANVLNDNKRPGISPVVQGVCVSMSKLRDIARNGAAALLRLASIESTPRHS
jgi:hypothetical protein